VILTTGYVDSDETIEDIDLLYKLYRAVDLAQKIQALMEAPQPANGDALPVHAGHPQPSNGSGSHPQGHDGT
jgi:hypothetical protein